MPQPALPFRTDTEFHPWQDIGWGLDFKTGRVQLAGAPPIRYQVYAPPSFWLDDWTVVGAHCGKGTFKIEVKPIGDTHVVGQVQYFNSAGKQVTEDFFKTTTVVVGNVYVTVKVRLKGAGLSSSCWVTVKGHGA